MITENTPGLISVDLGVTGMTCTSCSGRVERKLNKVPGAQATVNFATETANVRYDPASVEIPQLIDVVRGAGYDAFEITPDPPTLDDAAGLDPGLSEASGTDATSAARDAHAADLRKRLIISAVLSVPVLALSMIPQNILLSCNVKILFLNVIFFILLSCKLNRILLFLSCIKSILTLTDFNLSFTDFSG